MLVDRVEKALLDKGFIKGNIEGKDIDIRSYIKVENETEYKVVFVFNNEAGTRSGGGILEDISRRIAQILYMKKATNVDSICLVLTGNPEVEMGYGRGDNQIKSYNDANVKYWLLDSRGKRIMIFENQPDDFCDLYKSMEIALNSVDEDEKNETSFLSKVKMFPYATALLIFLNVAYFIYLEMIGSTLDSSFMLKHGASNPQKILNGGEYYRLVTSMFMHFGIEHILGNMFMLAVLGDKIEKKVKTIPFLFMYLSTGLIAGIVSCANATGDVVGAGASGAIYGILGVYIIVTMVEILQIPVEKRMVTLKSGVIRVILVVFLTMSDVLIDLSVDVTAHIAGLIAGLIIARLWFLLGPGREILKKRL